MAAKTIVRWNPSLSEQVAKRPGRYDEMPKSATMENRQNMEQHVRADFFLWIFWFPSSTLYFVQFYATVQRQKNPGLTPFSSGYEVDTIEQLKRAVRSQVKNVRSQVAKNIRKKKREKESPLPGKLSTFNLWSLSIRLPASLFLMHHHLTDLSRLIVRQTAAITRFDLIAPLQV